MSNNTSLFFFGVTNTNCAKKINKLNNSIANL